MFLPFIRRGMFTKGNIPALVGIALSSAFILISLSKVMLATETSGASVPQTTKSAFPVTTLLATVFSGENISYAPSAEVISNWTMIRFVSFGLFLIIVLLWVLLLKRTWNPQKSIEFTNIGWLLALGGGGVLLFPYLLGNSHDYRLIFLIPLTAGALLLTASRPIVGGVLAICAGIAAMTSAAMVPLPNGFIWSTPALAVGDAALMVLLAGIVALWLTTAFTTQRQGFE